MSVTMAKLLALSAWCPLAHAMAGTLVSVPLLPMLDQRGMLPPRSKELPKTSLLRASLSLGAEPTAEVEEAAWDVFTGPLGADALHASRVYFADVELGHPPQRFSVLFDTGSSRLVVPGANCTDPLCVRHLRYQNSTAATGASFSTHYGDGDLDVVPFRDAFCVGGACASDFPVYTVVADRSRSLGAFKYDGILGMAPASGFSFRLHDMVTHVADGANVRGGSPLFALYLSRDERVRRSEATLGGPRPELLAAGAGANEVAWFPLSAPGDHWAFDLKDIKVGGKRLFLCGYGSKDRCRGVLDSGTSQLVASQKLAEKVKGRLGVDMDCGNLQKLPSLSFLAVDGREFTLDPEDYVQRLRPSGGCFAAVSPVTQIEKDVILLGQPFLRRFYSVFDAGVPRRVGLAEAALPAEAAAAEVVAASGSRVRRVEPPTQMKSTLQAESRHKGRRGFDGPWRWENGGRRLVEACSVLLLGLAAVIVASLVFSRQAPLKADTSGIKFVNAYPVE